MVTCSERDDYWWKHNKPDYLTQGQSSEESHFHLISITPSKQRLNMKYEQWTEIYNRRNTNYYVLTIILIQCQRYGLNLWIVDFCVMWIYIAKTQFQEHFHKIYYNDTLNFVSLARFPPQYTSVDNENEIEVKCVNIKALSTSAQLPHAILQTILTTNHTACKV